ncbi:serine hydrolase [Lentzea sp. NPDC051838]|uniref:serine hydrolase domain-containing protein n=1 Tax=Lentzea sp. NPDC051838 TaxID=3154849 RepID=UPI0034165710
MGTFKLLVVAAVVLGCVPAAAASTSTLQRDVNTLSATGTTGVLAEVSDSSRARAGGVPWNAKHRIASTTKPFTATVVLQLVGEGELHLDDTVEQWLPGLVAGNDNHGSKITVRQLLGHKSGLRDYLDDLPLERATTPEEFKRERFRAYRPEQLVAMAVSRPPVFQPEEDKWSYSNTNYVLAEMIIEKATGASWQQAVHERIVEPLGLADTILTGTSAYLPSPRLAPHKRLRPGGPEVDVSTYVAGHGDASIISTTSDVNSFFRALLGGRLLKPAQLAEMQKTTPAEQYEPVWDEPGYGLGLMKRRLSCGEHVWFHGGGFLNAITDNAVTTDGRRAVTVFVASALEAGQDPIPQYRASAALIDHALCGKR